MLRFGSFKTNQKTVSAGATAENPLLAKPVSPELASNLAIVQELFTDSPDLVVVNLAIRLTGEQAALLYLEGLADKNAINNNVLEPLQFHDASNGVPAARGFGFKVTVGQVKTLAIWRDIEHAIFQGCSVLLVGGRAEAYSLSTQGWPQRAIEDPQIESSLKGAHQGLVETGTQNIALIRRYIPNRELKIKELIVGRRGQTKLSVMYLADVANPQLLQELESRIAKLDVDAIINTGELAEFIEDHSLSPFPQFIQTERPDSAASHILQGRFVVVVDRSPSVLVAPVTFAAFFQSIDDYSMRWSIASFIRLLRFFAFFVAIILPAFYIAVCSYHFEIIPIKLLLTIGEFRGRVPFPPVIEAIMMEVTIEMMREAGVRLPAPLGQTVGIVGGIVIGQAIVQAGLISNVMVIVVAFTAISSFILPNYDMVAAARLIRFMIMLGAACFGFFGIVICLMCLIGHLISLKSLGMPYGSPFAPVRFADWKDTFIRAPIRLLNKRPTSSKASQSTRQGHGRRKEENP